MPWSTQVAVTLRAGDTIINPTGIFVYSGAPGAGNLAAALAPASGTDQYGNQFVQGMAAYETIAGNTYALQLGEVNNSPAFFINNLTSVVNDLPRYSAFRDDTGGCGLEMISGKGTAGAGEAEIFILDSLASGSGHSTIDLAASQVQINGQTVTVPQSVSGSILTLPNDTNSGSTWVAGERSFMNNNWVANINSNFSIIVSALQTAGIFT